MIPQSNKDGGRHTIFGRVGNNIINYIISIPKLEACIGKIVGQII